MTFYTVPWCPLVAVMDPPEMPGDGVDLMLTIEAISHEIPELDALLDRMMAGTGMQRWMCQAAVQMAAQLGLVGMTMVDFSRAGSA